MSIVEIYKPEFSAFHETPTVTWREPKGPIHIAVNMLAQYNAWLDRWTDAFRDKYAPGPAFWESGGPQICRALRYCGAIGLVFEWESDRKVSYRWFARTPDGPTRYKTDHYSICSVRGEVMQSGEGRILVTLPTDEDVSFYWHASTMKEWLKPKLEPETKQP